MELPCQRQTQGPMLSESPAGSLRHQVPCLCMGGLHHIPSVVSVNHTHTHTLPALHSLRG